MYTAPDAHYRGDEMFTVVRCRGCGLGFVNPRPAPEEMGRYYPSTFYEGFETESGYHQKRYALEADIVERIAPRRSPRRLLDVGCANGGFPRTMRSRGWEVTGVEVSSTSARIVDFPVYTVPFPEIPVASPAFDAVTAWAVLEHVHDPKAHFRKAASVLEKGGVLVFLVTNFESLASRALFREDVPRHLHFFTESAVKRYLSETGFDLVDVEYSDRIYSLVPVGWLRRWVKEQLGQKYTWQDSRLTHDHWLEDHGLPRTAGNLARFAVRHPLSVLDRATTRLRGRWEMLTKQYGIVTYSARKR